MHAVEISNVSKRFGPLSVIEDLSIDIRQGEFMVFVGPSGSGKSTLLRMVAGLEAFQAGTIRIGGRVVNTVPARDRNIAMVFQDYALYPHMTVAGNMGFGLKMRGVKRAEIDRRVAEAAEILQITHLLGRRPRALSGGQRQRVAMGRSIVREPSVFLFDEPLSNLDAQLRGEVRTEIKHLHQRLATTMIYVTHDQVEAMTLADRIVVLRGGKVEQIGTPAELYGDPASRFVAGFIGSPPMSFLPATIGNGVATLPGGARLQVGTTITNETKGEIGIRAEHVLLADPTRADLFAEVDVVEPLGSDTLVLALIDGAPLTVRLPGDIVPTHGDKLPLSLPAHRILAFDVSGRRLCRSYPSDHGSSSGRPLP